MSGISARVIKVQSLEKTQLRLSK